MFSPALVSDTEWPADIARLRHGFAGQLNVYRMMAHNPELLAAWETLRNHIVLNSRLTPQQSEIVILRTGWRWSSRYEWMHHVSRARKAGLSEAAIAGCCEDSPTDHSVLIGAVDALLEHGRIEPPLADALAAEIGFPATFDVMATVGMYTTLAFIVESYGVPVDDAVLSELKGDPLADRAGGTAGAAK